MAVQRMPRVLEKPAIQRTIFGMGVQCRSTCMHNHDKYCNIYLALYPVQSYELVALYITKNNITTCNNTLFHSR